MQTYTQFAMKNNGAVHTAAEQAAQDMLLVLDNSGSMHLTDWPPNRWGGARQASEALLEIKARQYPDDRVGIVAFGSGARVLHPLANVRDHLPALKLAMDVHDADGDTNLAEGLELGQDLLQGGGGVFTGPGVLNRLMSILYDSPPQQPSTLNKGSRERVIILLTDGHSTRGKPVPIAGRIKAQGTRIHAIGIGGTPGDVDEDLLKEIATASPDGTPLYCFIADQSELLTKFQTLAHHIRPV